MRRTAVVTLGVAAALGTALLYHFSASGDAGRRRLVASPFAVPAATDAGIASPHDDSGRRDRLFGAAERGEEPSFADMLRSLVTASRHPRATAAAAAFQKEFMAEPGLRRVYEKFEAAGEAQEPEGAAKFMGELRREPAFAPLMEKWQGRPEGKAAIEVLGQDPKLARLVEQQYRAPAPAGVAALAKLPPGAAAAVVPTHMVSVRFSKGSLVAKYSPINGGPPSETSAEPVINTAGARRDGTGALAAIPQALASGTAEPARTGGGGLPGLGAHDVAAKLASLDSAKIAAMEHFLQVYPWLAPLGVARLHAIEDDVPSYGLWGACFALKLYNDCRQACASDARGNCVAQDAWKSCLDWRADRSQCISACHFASAYCVVPDDVETAYCKPKTTCGTLGASACPAPPPYDYCAPAWPGGAAAAPPPPAAATGLLNFGAGDQATCEQMVKSRWDLTVTCSLGGGCGVSCGRPGPDCPSANPSTWGFCLDPRDPSLPQRMYNYLAGSTAAECQAAIAASGLNVTATCSRGGGCGVSCGMPGPSCPSANPLYFGACFMGPAIPPWALPKP